MSAALVTGAAALIWGVTPNLTNDEVRQILLDSATPLPTQESVHVGAGRLDVHMAVRMALQNRLEVVGVESLSRLIYPDTEPYSFILTLQNDSLRTVDWQATYLANQSWVEIQDSAIKEIITTTAIVPVETLLGIITRTQVFTSVTRQVQGEDVSYGQPDHLTLVVSPTELAPGHYPLPITFNFQPSDTPEYSQLLDFSLVVMDNLENYMYLPLIKADLAGTEVLSASNYRWESPDLLEERITYGMFDESNLHISLPITFSGIYTNVQIYSDGFISFSESNGLDSPDANHCLPNTDGFDNAIYGWWTDLDPSSGRVSTFQPSSDRFVIEFENVPTAAGVIPAYEVNFQIVLYEDGRVQLNYRDVPEFLDSSTEVTIGVEMEDGLFYNQVACHTDSINLGRIPETEQTILLELKELY